MTVCNRCLLDDHMTWCEDCEKPVCSDCDHDDLNTCEATRNHICADCMTEHKCRACAYAMKGDD